MEYATRPAWRTREQQGSAPDAGASGSALPLGATGGAPAPGACAAAAPPPQHPSLFPPPPGLFLSHSPRLFPHLLVSSSHTPASSHTLHPKIVYFFNLFIKNLNFVSFLLLVLFVIFYISTPPPQNFNKIIFYTL